MFINMSGVNLMIMSMYDFGLSVEALSTQHMLYISTAFDRDEYSNGDITESVFMCHIAPAQCSQPMTHLSVLTCRNAR